MHYRHYKGGIYELIGPATLESDLTPMIVYRAADGSLWIRPAAVFLEMIEVDGVMVQRFAPMANQSLRLENPAAIDPCADAGRPGLA